MVNKSKSKTLILSMTIVMVFSVFVALPTPAYAEDANALIRSINTFDHGGTGSLTAVATKAKEVTVTGDVTNALNELNLDINSDVTVKWKAKYSGSLTTNLITLNGNGSFEILPGADLSNGGTETDSRVIFSQGESGKVIMNGGTISNTGGPIGIYASGQYATVTVNDGSIVCGDNAIFTNGNNSIVNINGGIVDGAGGGNFRKAISSDGSQSTVNITGGTVKSAQGTSLSSPMPDSTINIIGGTLITSSASYAVYIAGTLNISGNATIDAANTAITAAISAIVNIKGGTVKSNAAYWSNAISIANGELNMTGGTVSAKNGIAIYGTTSASAITISGGFVFAYGSSIIGNGQVIQMDSADAPAPIITSPAVVCAWNNINTTYTANTDEDLLSIPANQVKWGVDGILYGTDGFFPISGLTVNPLTATIDQFAYDSAGFTKTFNGKTQGINVMPKDNKAGKITAMYYNGSKTMPQNVGTYKVTFDAAEGHLYGAVNNMELGDFVIKPADISKVSAVIADNQWTGTQRRPTGFALKYNGLNFALNTNATIRSYGANKNIGKGTVQIAGKGNFAGTKTITFNIVPKKTSISKVTPSKKKMKVTWKKVSKTQKVSYYQVQYRVSGTKTWKTKTISATKTSLNITKLTKGKTYQVQVRSYTTVGGVKYYSPWSAVKTSKKIK